MRDTIKKRYEGAQTFLKDGCYFLSLMSIAEEVTGKPIDILEAIYYCVNRNYCRRDAWINNPCLILEAFTGKKWKLSKSPKLPAVVPDEMYTVEKWELNGGNHFRRRYMDTVIASNTVANGRFVEYYLFEICGE